MPYVATRLGRWFYEEHGAARTPGAPVIVLWHSFLCDGGMWRGQVRSLAEMARVVVFDGPGHGKSEMPPPFTLEENAEALADALDALDAPRVMVFGLSWGGMVGMRLALAHRERVAALALLDTSARGHTAFERAKYSALFALARHVGLPPFMLRLAAVPEMFGPDTPRRNPRLVDEWVKTASGFDPHGVTRAGDAVVLERTDISERLGRIDAPTLVLCGRDDRATPRDESILLTARIPGARLEWIEGGGHLSALERPEAVTAHLVAFAREVLAKEIGPRSEVVRATARMATA